MTLWSWNPPFASTLLSQQLLDTKHFLQTPYYTIVGAILVESLRLQLLNFY